MNALFRNLAGGGCTYNVFDISRWLCYLFQFDHKQKASVVDSWYTFLLSSLVLHHMYAILGYSPGDQRGCFAKM